MSNRMISNTAGLPDTFTPSIRPRYRAFNETHYASVSVPLACYSNYTCFHGIPVSASTFAQVSTTNFNNVVVDQHSYHPQHLSMSMKRENFVEIKEDEDDRRRDEQKWSADDDIREESCNGSGTLFERMAQQTRPRMMTNDESNNINSNNVEGPKFKQVI